MKVTRNTPRQLIVEDMPWLIAIMLVLFIFAFVAPAIGMMMDGVYVAFFFGLFGGGMGVAALAVFVRRVQVILDLDAGTATLRERSVFAYRQVIHPLDDVKEAKLESYVNSKGQRVHRPTLVLDRGMSAGDHPIIVAYTNTRGPHRLVEAINTWLHANRLHHPRPSTEDPTHA